jgi:hypothetical protein
MPSLPRSLDQDILAERLSPGLVLSDGGPAPSRRSDHHGRKSNITSDHDISILNNLITTMIDSADGFERAAGRLHSASLDELGRAPAVCL